MNNPGIETFLFDIATYSFCGFFACFAFMKWYLWKNEDSTLKERTRNSIWVELLFRYRDFTKKGFGKVHFIYYLANFFLLSIVFILGFGIFLHINTLQTPFNYILGVVGLLIFSLVIGMVYYMSRTEYYK